MSQSLPEQVRGIALQLLKTNGKLRRQHIMTRLVSRDHKKTHEKRKCHFCVVRRGSATKELQKLEKEGKAVSRPERLLRKDGKPYSTGSGVVMWWYSMESIDKHQK